jgi:hypothetical protein
MHARSSPLRHGAALLALVFGIAASSAASAGDDPNLVREGGIGLISALLSLGYGPLKIVYALSGTVLAGTSYLYTWGNRDVAMKVARMSLGGDYVITPAHLRGTDEIRFTGK